MTIQTPGITRPPKQLVAALQDIGAATCAGELSRLGIRNAHITGPLPCTPGKSLAGPALTLQMMPKREDLYQVAEYTDPEKQLHRHALYHTEPGDFIVVDARGDLTSGIFGEMMLTYFKGRGGVGVLINGCIRDWPNCQQIDLGYWLQGVTPNFHTQTHLMPFAVNGPVALNNVTVMPGDIIVADDDGAVVVPASLASEVAKKAGEHKTWEVFSKMKLEQGGDLRKYYPLRADAQAEYEAWQKAQAKPAAKKRK